MEKSFPLIAAKLAHSNILDTVRSELVEALQRQSNVRARTVLC